MKEHTSDDARCAECGASAVEGMNCWEQLGILIAWEYDDPELRAEHFLTVASYNLQHPAQFTEQALANLREGVRDYLDHGVSTGTLRQRASAMFEGSTRVLRPASERVPALRHWPMTIADVCLPHQPAGAAARVRTWAASIRAEL